MTILNVNELSVCADSHHKKFLKNIYIYLADDEDHLSKMQLHQGFDQRMSNLLVIKTTASHYVTLVFPFVKYVSIKFQLI